MIRISSKFHMGKMNENVRKRRGVSGSKLHGGGNEREESEELHLAGVFVGVRECANREGKCGVVKSGYKTKSEAKQRR